MNKIESEKNKEAGLPPQKVITLDGYLHNSLNLEVIPALEKDLTEAMHRPGEKIVFLELPDHTPEEVAFIEQMADLMGYQGVIVAFHLFELKHSLPSVEEIVAHMQRIARLPLDDVLSQKLLNISEVQNYTLFGVIDRLVGENGGRVVVESHADDVVTDLRELMQNIETAQQMTVYHWNSGDVAQALTSQKLYYQLLLRKAFLRESDIQQQIINLTGNEKKDIAVYSAFGGLHMPMMQAIEKNDPSVIVIENNLLPDHFIPEQIFTLLRQGKTPSDELYLQSFLYSIFFGQIETSLVRQKKAEYFALYVQKINQLLSDFVSTIPLEQGKSLCGSMEALNEMYKGAWDFVFNHL